MEQEGTGRRRRIVVVANRSWEADPLLVVMLAERARPRSVKDADIEVVHHPCLQGMKASLDPVALPRIRSQFHGGWAPTLIKFDESGKLRELELWDAPA